MYYNPSPPQESSMNLLISPFEPNQLSYPSNNHQLAYDDHSQLDYGTDQFDYGSMTQPLNVPMQQHSDPLDYLNMAGMSPVALKTEASLSTGYNRSPSPQADMKNRFANDFISRSPESSSSTETNLVSPPQQYQSSDFSWTTNSFGLPPTPMEQAVSQYNHHPATKRSSSVPPHFHKFKPHQQDSMYNQFQVTGSLHHQHHHMMPPISKAMPIQIQRVNASHNQPSRPVNVETQRRQLDEKLEKVNFDDITVAELKEMLRERGLSATGRKAELMNRLKEEYELLMMKGGSAGVAAAAAVAQQQQPQQQPFQQQAPLHRRVANLNLMDSPNSNRQQRLYAPYSPNRHTSHTQVDKSLHRLASSVPDSHTPSYLNEQFMMKTKQASGLRRSIESEEEQQPPREWFHSFSVSPPSSSAYYPTVPEEAPMDNSDIWDDQTLQNFLNQI